MSLVTYKNKGIYIPQANVYVDPKGEVDTAIITHAHADHAWRGHKKYVCSPNTKPFLKHRIGKKTNIQTKKYNQPFTINNVEFSLHPAGHILGSAQVLIKHEEETWLITGDFNNSPSNASETFTQKQAKNIITEATFSLPIYKWEDEKRVFDEMWRWIQNNKTKKQTTILFGYSLGKAQRILSALNTYTDEKILLHGAVTPYNEYYEKAGFPLANREKLDLRKTYDFKQKIIIAPPNVYRTKWMQRFKNAKTAFFSGWMTVRGQKRRKGYDKGFVISDHADFDGIIRNIKQSKAKNVYLTHGKTRVLEKYLQQKNISAKNINVLKREKP